MPLTMPQLFISLILVGAFALLLYLRVEGNLQFVENLGDIGCAQAGGQFFHAKGG